jgi:prephenate dehydrogenase
MMTVQITIIGMGQIGTSIGLALAKHTDQVFRVGHDRELSAANRAKALGALDRVDINIPHAVEEAGLVILAVPLDQVRETLKSVAQDLRPDVVVMDMAPVKETVLSWAKELLPAHAHYVGLVPVISPSYLQTHDSGAEAAHADLFQNGLLAIVSQRGTPSEAIKLAADLSQLLGAEHLFIDPVELDSMMAATHLLPQLIGLAENDPSEDVKVDAARVLGRFIELGELEEISAQALHKVEETLLRLARSEKEKADVQRAALESIGFSSRPEIDILIENAFQKHDPKWQTSALCAMGRSASAHWEEDILSMLDDPTDEVRCAAVRAAGELRLDSARQFLLEMLEEEEDDETFMAGIWSLSQIGGEEVRITLQTILDQTEDEDIIEFLEDAIDNLDLTDQINAFNLLAIDPDDEPDK